MIGAGSFSFGASLLATSSVTAGEIWRRSSDWSDWGEWITESPLGPMMKAILRAMRKATSEPELRKRVEAILERARRELEDASGARW